MKNDQVYIEHILDALDKIAVYTDNVSYGQFTENTMMVDAVLHEMQIIGEAAKRLSPEFKEKHPTIPWRAITGFRDKVVHDYFDVNVTTVWETIEMDLPQIKKALED